MNEQFLFDLLAGVAFGVGFMLLSWYARQPTVKGAAPGIKILAARYTVIAHILYGMVVFVVAALLGEGRVFGIQFIEPPARYVALPMAGGLCGLVSSFMLEFDDGLVSEGGSLLWIPVAFALFVQILMVITFGAAGGFVFIVVTVSVRLLLSLLLYQYLTAGIDTLFYHAGERVAVAVLVLIVLAAVVR